MKNIKLIAAATATAVAVTGLTAGASAAAGSAFISNATTSYTSPSDRTIPVDFLPQGTPVEALCFTEGQQLRNSYLWFKVRRDGKMGFVHRDTIGNIPSDLRHC
jgi:hypothetical protein